MSKPRGRRRAIVTLDGDLAGVAVHGGVLVVEGDQRRGAAELDVADLAAEQPGGPVRL